MKYLRYLNYILVHKWNVFLACLKLGWYYASPRLIFNGIIYDWSKFTIREFFPYVNFFYAKNNKKGMSSKRDNTGYYKPTDTGDSAFDLAWFYHQKRHKHHWQWWCLPKEDGKVKVFDMPDLYIMEMCCDWYGAARSQGADTVIKWWKTNNTKMVLSPRTYSQIEKLLESHKMFQTDFRLVCPTCKGDKKSTCGECDEDGKVRKR